MATEKVLSRKKEIVEALASRIKAAESGVVVDYRGITVEADTKLRRELRNADVEYTVVKNTLLKRASDLCGLSGLDDVLSGTTALATCASDPVAPARILYNYAKTTRGAFVIKKGFLNGEVVSPSVIEHLATLPPKPALYAQIAGTFNNIIAGLARAINAVAEQQGAPAQPAAE